VFDEAQAVKNSKTKRRRALAKVKADFRLALSGTPVENEVHELWSIFDLLNPGLLGTQRFFAERFDGGDETTRAGQLSRLAQLVAPFMLRRLKKNVLKELPPKTEVVLDVELSDKEREFYEVLRREARETVLSTKGPQRRLQIFAELTRLRRACCHPNLIVEDCDVGSSKLDAFTNLAETLMKNGHRALVFSQFVDHLSLIRERLDELNFSYQYLDGSTRPKARGEAVEKFQSGEGQFFLISLKAGGVGLNLTGADYVIHMDPWWNPAVEDQATDRAHRIGQQRPVTVYRLVAQDTIEERIIELHHQKRDLADTILEGQGQLKKLDLDQLGDLLS
jgi:SNF2 family DNA or RNA helicase